MIDPTQGQMSLEQEEFNRFMKEFKHGDKYKGQRLGQAFYNHFNLHKLTDQESLKNLYERDGEHAQATIRELFSLS